MASSGADSTRGIAPQNNGAAPLTPEALKADAGVLAAEARNVLDNVNAEAGAQLSQLADQAKDTVADVTSKAKGMATEQKELIAAQIGGVADAMQRVAIDLETNGGASAPYARMIADNAEQLSSTIRDNDLDQIMAKAQSFGRDQPVAFLGAAALLGFAASRFLLASARRTEHPSAPAPANGTAPLSSSNQGRA